MKTIKFTDIKTKEQLKSRVVNGVLSVGKYWHIVRPFVKKERFPGSEKITIVYSPGYGGSAKITRYI